MSSTELHKIKSIWNEQNSGENPQNELKINVYSGKLCVYFSLLMWISW